MRRNGFWLIALSFVPVLLGAQSLPGRELFELPLGSVAEGAALSVRSADGFRNPAAVLLPSTARARLSISSLTTGSDQGVAGQLAAFAHQGPAHATIGFTLARATVSGIARTDLDPQPIGSDVPYSGLVVSAHAARRATSRLSAGIALRYHHGEVDSYRRDALGIDAGLLVDSVAGLDLRLGAATFLWRPGTSSGEGAAFTGAADLRVAGRDSLLELRTSLAYSDATGLSRELSAGASLQYGPLEGRAGVARSSVSGHATTRPRLALGLTYARYFVAIAREESREGLAPVYHFTLVTTFDRPR